MQLSFFIASRFGNRGKVGDSCADGNGISHCADFRRQRRPDRSYLTKYSVLRESSERVVIDGKCASACTLVVNMIPRNQ
jgi:hypothetical protein